MKLHFCSMLIAGLVASVSISASASDLRSYITPKDSEKMSNMGLDMHVSDRHGLYLMTTDSRYVVKGDFHIVDRFNGELISSLGTLRAVKDQVDLSLVGIDSAKLAAATMGAKDSKAGATLFFNPLSKNSSSLLKKISYLKRKGQYVHVVPFPTTGNSMEEINNVICGFQDAPDETLEALLKGRADFKKCTLQDSLMRSLLTATLLAQGQMPMAITSSGRLLLGKSATQFDEIVASETP